MKIQYLKLLPQSEIIDGNQYQDGLVEGVTHYFPVEIGLNPLLDLNTNWNWVREVKLPTGSLAQEITKEVRFRRDRIGSLSTNRVEMGPRYNLLELDTWKYLGSIGTNLSVMASTPLRWVCSKGRLEVVKYLIQGKVKRPLELLSALEEAVKLKDPSIARYLLESGADVSCYEANRSFEIACLAGSLEIVKYMIKKGHNPFKNHGYGTNDRFPWYLGQVRDKGFSELAEFLEGLK
jgi:hypothetical protein